MQLQHVILTSLIGSAHCDLKAFWLGVKGYLGIPDKSSYHQVISVGENPFGKSYSLPQNNHWVSEESFTEAHAFSSHIDTETYCHEDEEAKLCYQELGRSFHVQVKGGYIHSPCILDNCDYAARIKGSRGSVIKLAEIKDLTMEKIYQAHLDNDKECLDDWAIVRTPGEAFSRFEQSDIHLHIKVNETLFLKGNFQGHREETFKFLLALNYGYCDSFLSPIETNVLFFGE